MSSDEFAVTMGGVNLVSLRYLHSQTRLQSNVSKDLEPDEGALLQL